jgi:hypothetical protein
MLAQRCLVLNYCWILWHAVGEATAASLAKAHIPDFRAIIECIHAQRVLTTFDKDLAFARAPLKAISRQARCCEQRHF